MKALDQLERIKRISELIQNESTGTPVELADSLNISVSHLYRTLEELKILGVPISYSKTRKTYFFERKVEVDLRYSLKVIDGKSIKKIFGGHSAIFTLNYFFLRD